MPTQILIKKMPTQIKKYRVMLEIQLILQLNFYKLIWHPKWRVSHQP